MYNDSFKSRYTSIPFATYAGDYQARGTARSTLSHCHREMELLAILDGEAIFHIDGCDYSVTAGDVLAVSPYCLHATSFLADKPCRHVCLCFDLSLLHDRALCTSLEDGSARIRPHVAASHPAAKALAEGILQAFDAHAEQGKGWEFATVSALSGVFSVFVAHGLVEGDTRGEERDRFCYRALGFIEAHVAEPITSSDAADALYLSHGHFCRTFRASFGYPFGEYLTMLRIERAEHLLRATDWRISHIAGSVGFESFSYFGKKFRESTSYTPSAYRKRYQ